ncbi:MAG: SIMPL domain-containing protein [Candidatus Yanofskybacteria bacterium]|nr:SIMPL domain-containing protein [Candidatus Yanofskybacteria bacterium]
MNEQIKNALGIALIGFLVVIAYSGMRFAGAIAEEAYPARTLPVHGEGKVVAIPDTARFSFSVITEGKEVARIQEQNTRAMNQAIDFLKTKGISEQDIRTTRYSIDPQYQYFRCPADGGLCPPPQIVGYVVTQSAQATLRDFELIGEALAGVVENGANSVSSISFTVEDQEALQQEARSLALIQAKEKADAIAQQAGLKLGKLVSVQDSFSPVQPMFREGFGGAQDIVAPSPQIEPGSQEISVTVTLVYEIR